MAYWNQCYADLVLSGKKYDGKGFGLRGLWNYKCQSLEEQDKYDSKYQFPYVTFVDGKKTRHVSEKYREKFEKSINMPWDYENGTHEITITEDTVDNCVYLRFGGGFRDGGPNVEEWASKDRDEDDFIINNGLRNWFIGFVKSLIEDGWKVSGTYTIDSGSFLSGYYPEEQLTVDYGTPSGLDSKIASIDCRRSVGSNEEDTDLFRTYKYYLHDLSNPKYLYSTKIFKENIC